MNYEEFTQNFSANLRQRRKAAGLTMNALADQACIDRTTLVHYERGKTLPNIHTAYQIAVALGCTIDELLGVDTYRTSSRFCARCGKCVMPEGITIKPDGVHDLDPCIYEMVETHPCVDVEVLRCQKCGHTEIQWRKRTRSRDEQDEAWGDNE